MFRVVCRFLLVTLLVSLEYSQVQADKPCVPRNYGYDSVVCVCNSTYCDEISTIVSQGVNRYVCYTSTRDGLRLNKTSGTLSSYDIDVPTTPFPAYEVTILEIDRETKYQSVYGFGGAFTDATGINIISLPTAAQDNLIKSFFSSTGLEFNMARIPIGGSDFSEYPYAYNMYPEADFELSNFSLSAEDYKYKIPLVKKAMAVSKDQIFLMGAVWSPPLWMKTNKAWGGISTLRREYYQTYAEYHYRFLEEYSKEGISFWAISTGNEPTTTVVFTHMINTLGWWPISQGSWILENLGPTIRNSKFTDVKILALDDQRIYIPIWIELMSLVPEALSYIDGIAVHWYFDMFIGPFVLDQTHNKFPNKFLIYTEACAGYVAFSRVKLGSWGRAESIFKGMLANFNKWVTGWIDWNLALNKDGGPNWYGNFVDAPIIVLPESGEFLKQPVFYALGHFSKFVPRYSKRVKVQRVSGCIDHVAFLRPDGGVAVLFYNPKPWPQIIIIREKNKGAVKIHVPPKSIQSLVYW